MRISKNSIGAKLLGAFLAMGAIIAVQGVYGYGVLERAGSMVIDPFDRPLMAVNYARAANFDFAQIERKLLQCAVAMRAQCAMLDADIDALAATFVADLGVAEERSPEADERRQIETIKSLMQRWTA